MTTAADLDQLLTPQQVADRLAVSVRTVRRLQWSDQLPHVRIGDQIRFRASDLAAYMKGLSDQV